MTKYLLLLFIVPTMIATAENVELTKQLGKTVLYGDIALSPDGAHLTWVQSTAAHAKPKQTYVCATSGNSTVYTRENSSVDGRQSRC